MRTLFLLTGLLFVVMSSPAQKKSIGIGGELSVLSLKPTARWWVSKTDGFDVFGGIAAEFEDFKPNDYEAGAKYLRSFINQRTDRTYFGLMGKFIWLETGEYKTSTNLPVFGVFVGKEWYLKRRHLKGFAAELGYQFGKKEYNIQIGPVDSKKGNYNEFALMVNVRYVFYKK